MPAQDYNKVRQCVDFINDLIETNKATLGPRGVTQVWYSGQEQITGYPAVVCEAGPLRRERHNIGQSRVYEYTFTVFIYVMHALMTVSHKERTQEDWDTADAITNLLHLPQNKTLGGHIIDSLINYEEPGTLKGATGDAVVSTRLTWEGTNVCT